MPSAPNAAGANRAVPELEMFLVPAADAEAPPANRTATPSTAPTTAVRTGARRARTSDQANRNPRSRMLPPKMWRADLLLGGLPATPSPAPVAALLMWSHGRCQHRWYTHVSRD